MSEDQYSVLRRHHVFLLNMALGCCRGHLLVYKTSVRASVEASGGAAMPLEKDGSTETQWKICGPQVCP